jgi:hypothetical protein
LTLVPRDDYGTHGSFFFSRLAETPPQGSLHPDCDPPRDADGVAALNQRGGATVVTGRASKRVAAVIRLVLAASSAGLAIAWAASPQAALGQYKQLDPKVDAREAKRLIPKVATILRNPNVAAVEGEAKQDLDSYFLGYFFPAMSQNDPTALSRLTKGREVLFRQFLDAAKSPAVRQYLIDTTLKAMGALSADNYHPAVRYNAVLVLAALDAQPATTGANAKAPAPLPEGTKALLLLLQQQRVKDVVVPSSVKVGALVGLERHARFGIAQDLQAQVDEACQAVINREAAPDDVSQDVHGWMKCLAVRVLVNLHAAAATPAVHEAMTKLVGSETLGLNDRCYVARQYARMKYGSESQVDMAPAALALGDLAKDVLAAEGKKAEEFEEQLLGDPSAAPAGFGGAMEGGPMRRGGYGEGGMGMSRGGYGGEFGGGGLGGFEEQGPRYEKRRLLQALVSIVQAATALKPAADAETQARLNSLAAPLQAVVVSASAKDALEVDVVQDVMKLRGQIAALVDGWSPEAKPPADKPADDDAFAESP